METQTQGVRVGLVMGLRLNVLCWLCRADDDDDGGGKCVRAEVIYRKKLKIECS